MVSERHLIWWSAGAASTVAAMLHLRDHPESRLIYTDPGIYDAETGRVGEHPDNVRFRRDVEQWLDVKIEVLKSDTYADPADVWERTGWIVGEGGARCTVELKKKLRQAIEDPDDIQVFGYTAEEATGIGKRGQRVARFRAANPDVRLVVPLVDHMLGKADCLGLVERAGIDLPHQYRLGYQNANCIGCPHGGMGYWNMIRRDYPLVFSAMAERERRFDNACCRPGGEPVFLDELDPERGDIRTDPDVECSLLCISAEVDPW